MTAYYNENHDPAADWLENLIAAGLIADGVVDRRSIKEVQPGDVEGFTQVHLFAGIGGWSNALRMAGWPDTRPIWTASCPCQPFSQAGKGAGTDDPRHLWPDVLRLLGPNRPPVIMGEQVAGTAGYAWFDGVCADLEGEGYTGRAVDIPACAVDAPHQRNRLYWVGVADGESELRRPRSGVAPDGFFDADLHGLHANPDGGGCDRRQEAPQRSALGGTTPERDNGGVGDAFDARLEGHAGNGDRARGWPVEDRPVAAPDGGGGSSWALADCDQPVVQGQPSAGQLRVNEQDARTHHGRNGSWWAGADWIVCHDNKARRVADASAPLLAHGVRGRVAVSRPGELCPATHPEETRWVSRIGAWAGFGNAIVPPLAAEVIRAFMETEA